MTNDPWGKLAVDEARRVNIDGQFDFFWVVLENSMPGLVLKLSSLPEPMPRLPKLKNLIVSFRPAFGGSAFVIGLKAGVLEFEPQGGSTHSAFAPHT